MVFSYNNAADDTPDFLARNHEMDRFISSVVAVCDYIKAKKKGKKDIMLSFDEWNVWYHSNNAVFDPWCEHPHQLEDIYNFEDALLVGSLLITLISHCDRVKCACLAQLVNVIAPIMTSDTGAWRQTIYYPFLDAGTYGSGTVLNTLVKSPVYDSRNFCDMPYIDSVVVISEEEDAVTIFAVNKNLEEDIEVTSDLRQFRNYRLKWHKVLHNDDLKAVNTEAAPLNVAPAFSSGTTFDSSELTAVLQKKSWNVIRLEKSESEV